MHMQTFKMKTPMMSTTALAMAPATKVLRQPSLSARAPPMLGPMMGAGAMGKIKTIVSVCVCLRAWACCMELALVY